jgi:hypothetical protein
MKRILLSLFLLVTTTLLNAMGGVWAIQFSYELNGKAKTGYIYADFWARDYEKVYPNGVNRSTKEDFSVYEITFEKEFRNKLKDYSPLTIYDSILDNTLLASKAKFPMVPYELIHSSGKPVDIAVLKKVKLIKIWVKDDYGIYLQTDINKSDINWISKTPKVDYPLGEDVGCRMVLYQFNQIANPFLVDELSKLYLKKEKWNDKEQERFKTIVAILKNDKVVVVELCGC